MHKGSGKDPLVVRLATRRAGGAASEFALVMPMVSLILMSIVQFGATYHKLVSLTGGVEAAALELSVGRSSATVWTDTVNRFKAATGTLDQTKVVLTASVNGVACATNAACQTALTSANGRSAVLTGTYPCNLKVMGFDAVPGCTLTATMSDRIQ